MTDMGLYYRKRAWAINLLGNKCARCGSVKKLEVDHIDPSSKEIKTSRIWHLSKGKIQPELMKCQLLCKPCHARKTMFETELWKLSNVARTQKPSDYIHGTSNCYSNRKCRCSECRTAWAKYMRNRKVMVYN